MTTIVLVPENPRAEGAAYRAVAGEVQSVGATAGQALDALTAQLGGTDGTTLVVVQPMRPDVWFGAEQQQRLADLMERWRAARDGGPPLPDEEKKELEGLVKAELEAAAQRSSALLHQLPP